MSEIEDVRLGLYGTKHLKCNHLMTLGFKGLRLTDIWVVTTWANVVSVSASAVDCLERLFSEMTCCVQSGILKPTHSLTQSVKLKC